MNDMTTEYVAAFDAGTTALKGALVNGQGCIVASASSELDLIINGDYREQSPDQWWQAFCSASRHMIEQAMNAVPIMMAMPAGMSMRLVFRMSFKVMDHMVDSVPCHAVARKRPVY